MNQLTTSEQTQLAQCERVISEGRVQFAMVADALQRIRDGRLYRASHDTFEQYCREKWGWSRQRASQYIQAAEVSRALPPECQQLLTNEGSSRALGQVEPAKRAEVLTEAAQSGPVTAKSIRAAAERVSPPQPEPDEPEPPRIRTAKEEMDDTETYSEFLSCLASLGRIFERLKDNKENARQLVLDRYQQ